MIDLVDFVRFSLAFIRWGTFFAAVPLLNMRSVPVLVKLGLAALCALAAPPLWLQFEPDALGALAGLALGEAAIGLVLALVVILVFAVVTFAGHFVDTPLGFGMASVFDPALGGQIPVFSQVYHVLAALIFLGLDAHLWVLRAVYHSFEAIPVGSMFQLEPSLALIMDLVQQVFVLGIQIALPIIATILLTDMGLGIVIRAVPQINVFVLGFPIKIAVGLVVVVFTFPTLIHVISQLFSIDGLLFRYFQGLLASGGS